jgi:hypothetical protein
LFSVDGVTLGGAGAARSIAPSAGGHCLATWAVDAGRHSDAREDGREAAETRKHDTPTPDAQRIDWNDSFHGLGAGVAATQLSGKRGAPQPNLTDFDQRPKADKKSKR